MGFSYAIQCHVVGHETGVGKRLARIQFHSLAKFFYGLIKPSQDRFFKSQDAVWCEVAGIGLRPKFADLNGLVDLVRDELVVAGRNVEFLAVACVVAQREGLPKRFLRAFTLPEDLIGAPQICVGHSKVGV